MKVGEGRGEIYIGGGKGGDIPKERQGGMGLGVGWVHDVRCRRARAEQSE